MANPFTGIVSSDFKALFVNVIDALLENTALTVPCKLIYGDTLWTECTNCYYDSVNEKSSGQYKPGGSTPFSFGLCPVCYGQGRIPDEQYETVYLAVLWDYKDWVGYRGMAAKVMLDCGYVQTMSKMSTSYAQLKRCKSIVIDTSIESYKHHYFDRDGEPNPAGFGASTYVFTMWKAAP